MQVGYAGVPLVDDSRLGGDHFGIQWQESPISLDRELSLGAEQEIQELRQQWIGWLIG